MKKRSIFTVVFAALMVLAILAGCEQASINFPKKVVSAEIVQVGDLLEGQNFDPSKFEVKVYYDDDSEDTLKGNVVTGTSPVSDATTVSANAGIGVDGDPYQITGAPVLVTSIKSIGIKVPETAVGTDKSAAGEAVDLTNAGVVVTATYTSRFDSKEYTVDLPYAGLSATSVEAKLDAALSESTPEGTATVAAEFGSLKAEEKLNVVYTTKTDYSSFEWDGTISYAIVEPSVDNDVRHFKNGDFDGKAMIQLYKTLTDGTSYAFELIENDSNVKFWLDGNATKFGTDATQTVNMEYKYLADAAYQRYEYIKAPTRVLSGLVATDTEGIFIATKAENASAITITLVDDYAVDLEASLITSKKYFVPGESFAEAYVVLKATYASGNVVTYTVADSDTFEVVDPKTFTKDDIGTQTFTVKLNGLTEVNYPETAKTETTIDVQVVENYPTAVTLAPKGYKAYGSNYSIDDFVVTTIAWADTTADYDEENPAPVTLSYTFEPVAPSKENIGITNEVKYTWKCNELDVTGTGTVQIGVQNIPVSVVFNKTTDTLSANQSLTGVNYDVTVKWADGSEGLKDGFTVKLDQEYATSTGKNDVVASAGDTIQLTGTWSYMTFTDKVDNSISVTLK